MTNEYIKSEDFIGKTFNNGKLKVVGIHGKQGSATLFKVTCDVCSKDPELFPDGYFVSTKSHLKKGQIVCGCGKNVRWKPFQYLIIARRAGEKKGFIVHGFAEEFHGKNTKVLCECLIDQSLWYPTVTSLINNKCGCPNCAIKLRGYNRRIPEYLALEKCNIICKEMKYTTIGFPDNYKNAYSKFEYKCPKHGIQRVSYNDFINNHSRCRGCYEDRRKELSPCFYGWYPERAEEQDYLYVMNFNNQYIKVGRSFDIPSRLGQLPNESGIYNIEVLCVYTALHKEIYTLEQELHDKLTEMGFYHFESTWSIETFNTECLPVLNKLLDEYKYTIFYMR